MTADPESACIVYSHRHSTAPILGVPRYGEGPLPTNNFGAVFQDSRPLPSSFGLLLTPILPAGLVFAIGRAIQGLLLIPPS